MLACFLHHERRPHTLSRVAPSFRLVSQETSPDRVGGFPPRVRALRRDLKILEPQGIEYRRATPDHSALFEGPPLTRITAQDLSCTFRISGIGSFRLAMIIIAASRYRSFCANTAS